MTISKIIVIHPSTNRVLARCSAADGWCLSLSVFSGLTSFFGHDSEIIQEWLCDVSASTLLQAIVPRVFVTGDYMVWRMSHWLACVVLCTSMLTILEICSVCKLGGIAFGWECISLRCVDIGVSLVLFASFWHCWLFQRCVSSVSYTHLTLPTIWSV